MTRREAPALPVFRWPRHTGNAPLSLAERVLHNLGARSSFADTILGDLAEQRANLASAHGETAAQWWYVREAFRSVPHLLLNAVVYGGPLGRARVAALLSAVMLVIAVALGITHSLNGPPARLLLGRGVGTAGLIVNSRRPLQMSTMVFDAAGHALPATAVRYRVASGAAIDVTPRGVVTCTRSGDASLGATLGAVTTSALLRCRPVSELRTSDVLNLILGDSTSDVPFEALGPDGRPVTLLAGSISADDTTLVTLEGQRVRTRASGTTWITTHLGDAESATRVHIYEHAASPETIRRGQHLAIPVRLTSGEVHRWHLPAASERYFVTTISDRSRDPTPHVAIAGANCEYWFDTRSFQCAAPHGASLFVYVSPSADPARPSSGMLAVWREP